MPIDQVENIAYHKRSKVRLFLAILVAITNAAGPWLCCCAFAATIVRPLQANSHATPVSKQAVCPHCRTTNEDKTKAPIQKPAEPHHNCMPGVTPVIPAVTSEIDDLPILSFEFWETRSVPQTVKATVYVHVRLTPLLTSDERVRMHQVMNC